MILALALFAFWVVLSGMLDSFHLGLGALCALAAVLLTRPLAALPPPVAGLHAGTWARWPGYAPWLLWQIWLSAVSVAKVVLHPRLPISPAVIRFRCPLPHRVAHLTLANSITLTPGTVTVDLAGDEYTVHALTSDAAAGLVPAAGEGEMQARVRALFDARPFSSRVAPRGPAGSPRGGAGP